ncbi:MAG: WecB/TagA/CpsF family glycosyltransferase [Candidatus Levyibacteriota bacterium]
MPVLPSINLLGIEITTASKEKVLEYIYISLKKPENKLKIFTPNPEIIVYARSHPDFQKVLNEADIALPDGIGISLASVLTGKGLIRRITGTDLVEELLQYVERREKSQSGDIKKPYKIGLFGAGPGVAEQAADCLQKKYSGTEILFASDVWDEKKLKGKHLDILFVALGFPKQERWISENLEKIPATIGIGVGGAFDFISGDVSRAPKFLRRLGLEWLYRLMVQPWRIKRQLSLISFFMLVLRESLFRSHRRHKLQNL